MSVTISAKSSSPQNRLSRRVMSGNGREIVRATLVETEALTDSGYARSPA
jgi:hypothetical protein